MKKSNIRIIVALIVYIIAVSWIVVAAQDPIKEPVKTEVIFKKKKDTTEVDIQQLIPGRRHKMMNQHITKMDSLLLIKSDTSGTN